MIPKFDVYHTNLHSGFILFEKYIEFLKQEFFNGIVQIENNQNRAFLFMIEGEVQICFHETGNGYKRINTLDFASFLKSESFISSYRCRPDQIEFFSKLHTAKLIYNDLSSDIINPVKLINRCKTDQFTGYIEADDGSKKNMYIFFLGGRILGAMNVNSRDGKFEEKLTDSILQNRIMNTTINLYKLSNQSHDLNEDRNHLIKCYEEIFQLLEQKSNTKDFSSAWRKEALELSDKYVFLDPFAGEFNFENGKIDLWEKVNVKAFAHGVEELTSSIARKNRIPEDDINSIKNRYVNILGDYEIRV